MQQILNQKGISLIEVLASIVIISILFSVVSSYFVSSIQHSKSISNKYASIQIAESLLDTYLDMDYSFLELKENTTESIDIENVLHLDSTAGIKDLSATLKVKEHPDPKINNRVLILEVNVLSIENGIQKEYSLEGYKRK